MTVVMPPRADPGENCERDASGKLTLRLSLEERCQLMDLWRAYSVAHDRVYTLSDVLRRCLRDSHAALVLAIREAREAEDAAFAQGHDSAPAQQLPPRPKPPAQDHTSGGKYLPPRKARQGGGSVIDWDAVRAQADGGCEEAARMLGGRASTKKEKMRDRVAHKPEGQ